MEHSSEPPDGASVLDDLKKALDGAARCIDLARRETARIDASLRAQSVEGGAQIEQRLLDNARKGREQLSLLEAPSSASLPLLLEVPPMPPPSGESGDAPEIVTQALAVLVEA
jgi:hypothetical protein